MPKPKDLSNCNKDDPRFWPAVTIITPEEWRMTTKERITEYFRKKIIEYGGATEGGKLKKLPPFSTES